MNRRRVLLTAGALAACAQARVAGPARPWPTRGVNLGNALEAPNEGDWGYRIEPSDIDAIARAGFDGVRLPVRWDAHTEAEPPYRINPALMERVEEIALQLIAKGLKLQLDAHHYEDLIARPREQRQRFIAIWRQIAERFADAPQDVVTFEPLNEPFGAAWNGPLLTEMQAEIVSVIRQSNPRRAILLGGGDWNTISGLDHWRPPEAENIAVTVHYYEPYAFTHQRAEWLEPNAPVYPRAWGKTEDVARVREHIAHAARWTRERGLALQIGEFGVNRAVQVDERAAWTQAVRQACEAEGAGWCVWDFAGAFPIYDREAGRFTPMMISALLI